MPQIPLPDEKVVTVRVAVEVGVAVGAYAKRLLPSRQIGRIDDAVEVEVARCAQRRLEQHIDGSAIGSARVVFLATDRGSFISRAEYSINGGEWQAVYPDDGISDGPDERYTVSVPVRGAGEYAVTLRVFDATGNVGNVRALVRK